MISTSIVNVTSYTGLELLRLLSQHPEFRVVSVTARSNAGKALVEVFPQLQGTAFATLPLTEEPEQSELAFVCLPHAAAAASAIQLLQRGTKVVDLSADFRLRDAAQYAIWYKHTHPAPALLETAIYGLCERYRSRMAGATLVANPGCYATAAILALIPALASGTIGRDIIIDAKSGASGAGRSPTQGTHYSDMNEDVSAYSVNGHRHLAEITQELEAAARDADNPPDDRLRITFIPHLMPMTRGILATCYADLQRAATRPISTTAEAIALYEEFYANEPFIRIVNEPPHTKWTYGSNLCLIHPMVDTRTGRLLVIACLDNLVKGAAGQALQNANRLFGLPETTGLPLMALYP
jgi:N-acetyl-gamma-glutamyl-phosphate reductase